MTEICRRLDGMPLAIELAAARIRALSLAEIVDSLHDRFRLLTGGARTVVRRQQTLRASVDWSHALLTEPERVLFRRLAVFVGGFDLDAAQAIGGGGNVERFQVLDQITLLVDKSLVVAESSSGRTRYRLLETVRQYALEKLGESGEADVVRACHRDYYTSKAAQLDAPATGGHEQRIEQAETELGNLRAAYGWSRENSDIDLALRLASSLQPLWLTRGRVTEGLAWLDAALADEAAGNDDMRPARGRALADKATLLASVGVTDSVGEAEQAVTIAAILRIVPCWYARSWRAGLSARTTSTCRGNISTRRPTLPVRLVIRGGWPKSSIGRRLGHFRPATWSRRGRPVRKRSNSLNQSVIGTSHVPAAFGSPMHGRTGEISPARSPSSATWSTRRQQLTTRCCR